MHRLRSSGYISEFRPHDAPAGADRAFEPPPEGHASRPEGKAASSVRVRERAANQEGHRPDNRGARELNQGSQMVEKGNQRAGSWVVDGRRSKKRSPNVSAAHPTSFNFDLKVLVPRSSSACLFSTASSAGRALMVRWRGTTGWWGPAARFSVGGGEGPRTDETKKSYT